MLSKRKGVEHEEGEKEDCHGVVCDNTGNATKKNKGGLSTTPTGEDNLDGPDDVGGLPNKQVAADRRWQRRLQLQRMHCLFLQEANKLFCLSDLQAARGRNCLCMGY